MNVLRSKDIGSDGLISDFNFCIDGELVTMPTFVCDNGSTCGCNRSMVGMNSGKATTSIIVDDDPEMTLGKLVDLNKAMMISFGWQKLLSEEDIDQKATASAVMVAAQAGEFAPGTLLRRHSEGFHVRILAKKETEWTLT